MSALLPPPVSELLAIERRRKELSLTKFGLERAAGLVPGHYWRLISGMRRPRPDTLARLRAALSRAAISRKTEGPYEMAAIYRLALALSAQAMGADPRAIQQQDPGRRATQSPDWMRAAEVRRLAVYLMNTGCGFNQAEVARAAGMTRQAVSLACRALEERRENKDFDRMLDELTAAVRRASPSWKSWSPTIRSDTRSPPAAPGSSRSTPRRPRRCAKACAGAATGWRRSPRNTGGRWKCCGRASARSSPGR